MRKPFCQAAKPTFTQLEILKKPILLLQKIQKQDFFCSAHLNEGHCFPCSYRRSEIYLDSGILRISHRDSKGNIEGVCEDFRIPDEQWFKETLATCKAADVYATRLKRQLSELIKDVSHFLKKLESEKNSPKIPPTNIPIKYPIRKIPFVPNAVRNLPFSSKSIWAGMKVTPHFQCDLKKYERNHRK